MTPQHAVDAAESWMEIHIVKVAMHIAQTLASEPRLIITADGCAVDHATRAHHLSLNSLCRAMAMGRNVSDQKHSAA